MSYHRTSEAAPLSGAATMTVCTNHLALCHLVEDALPSAPPDTAADGEFLVPEMIELEDNRILLAAVSARVIAQIFDDESHSFRQKHLPSLLGRIDVFLAI